MVSYNERLRQHGKMGKLHLASRAARAHICHTYAGLIGPQVDSKEAVTGRKGWSSARRPSEGDVSPRSPRGHRERACSMDDESVGSRRSSCQYGYPDKTTYA